MCRQQSRSQDWYSLIVLAAGRRVAWSRTTNRRVADTTCPMAGQFERNEKRSDGSSTHGVVSDVRGEAMATQEHFGRAPAIRARELAHPLGAPR
jgi:hypothetical protein